MRAARSNAARAIAFAAAATLLGACSTGGGAGARGSTSAAGRASAAASARRLEVKRDPSGSVLLRLRPAAASADDVLTLIAGASYSARAGAGVREVLLGFRRVGKQFRFGACKGIALQADDVVVARRPARRETQIGGKRLHEYIYTLVPPRVARAFAAAKAASVWLCDKQHPVPDVERQQLRRFVERLPK